MMRRHTATLLTTLLLGVLLLGCNKPILVLEDDTGDGQGLGGNVPSGPDSYYDLAAGSHHTCAVLRGRLSCWGSNVDGQVGQDPLSSSQDVATPVTPDTSRIWKQVACGNSHSCALTEAGQVLCWGSNVYGQLGDGTTNAHHNPAQVDLPARATAIRADGEHSCALLEEGDLYCWGRNGSGQLGQQDEADTNSLELSPVRLGTADQTFSALFTGTEHTCAISGGTLYCTGNNQLGQLGLGSGAPISRRRLTAIDEPRDFVAGAGSTQHSCAITERNQLYCWGDSAYSGLGEDISARLISVPTRLPNPTAVDRVRLGPTGGCALADRALYCWGSNSAGQLALGKGVYEQDTPALVDETIQVQNAALGESHICALTTSGVVACAGLNEHGEVGDGTLTQRWSLHTIAGQSLQ